MLAKLVEYHWAEHLDDALLLLNRTDMKTVPLAGGTHLLAQTDDSIQAVVDLRDLDLSYISEDARGIHIGAMTTLQQIVDAPLAQEPALGGVLARCALTSSSSRLVRNCATVGGTIATGLDARDDLMTALIALDAEIVVRSGSRTQVNLSGGTAERPGLALSGVVYKGKRERRIACNSYSLEQRANELIVEVVIPRPSTSTGAACMRIARTPTDVALLSVVAQVQLEDGIYKKLRLVFGGIHMEPYRLQSLERQLEGRKATNASNTIDSALLINAIQMCMRDFRPPSDLLVTAAYRRVSGVNLAYRVLEEAINVALWRSMVSSGRGA